LTGGREVLILEPRLDRAELLASACEEAAPEVTSYRHISRREDVFGLLAGSRALLLASADDAAGFETLLRVFRLIPAAPVIAVTADADPGWEARLIQEGVGDVITEGEIDGPLLARRIRQVAVRARLREAQDEFPLIDPLTGLMNRAAFLFLGDRKLGKAQHKSQRTTVASIEIEGWRETLFHNGALAADELLLAAVDSLRPMIARRCLSARLAPATLGFLFVDAEPNAIRAEVAAANGRLRQRRGAGALHAACRLGIVQGEDQETLSELIADAQSRCCGSIKAFAAGT
jgi:PleD family two-component response regulator